MASIVDTSVKQFNSKMSGAPVLNGTAGAMIALLRACLVDGFGSKSVDSMTVTNGVATMNIASGHSAIVDAVILVAGATPAGLNGEQKVTAITATSISFAVTGVADGAATGTITVKIAPAGWAIPFQTGNVAAFKSNDAKSTGCYLRIDDTAANSSRVIGCETMSDVNSYTGPFPTTAQQTGAGLFWGKSDQANTTARQWQIFADSRFVIINVNYPNSASAFLNVSEIVYFGDIVSTKLSGDNYSFMISGMQSEYTASYLNGALSGFYQSSSNLAYCYLARSYLGIGTSIQTFRCMPKVSGSTDSYSGNVDSAIPFPNPVDGGIYFSPMTLTEAVNYVYRGNIPGLFGVAHKLPSGTFVLGDIVAATSSMSGRRFKACVSTYLGANINATMFVDTTGPWR